MASVLEKDEYKKYINSLSSKEQDLLNSGKHFYEISFSNIGGLVMPIIVQFEYVDNTTEERKIPAEIWRFNQSSLKKVFITDKEVKQITLDPFLETADTDTDNNSFPRIQQLSRFELFKNRQRSRKNPMQKMNDKNKKAGKSGTN